MSPTPKPIHQPIHHVFVFLEIFAKEGGIQSYVKDLLGTYIQLCENKKATNDPEVYHGDVFLLRDQPESFPELESEFIRFHYLKTNPLWLGRFRLAWELFWFIVLNRPQLVICGHVNLVFLLQCLCRPLGIPYTVIVHGKEVWAPLPNLLNWGLKNAAKIWTVSRYSRDRASRTNQIPIEKFTLLSCVVDGNTFTPGEKPPHLLEKYGLQDARVLMTVARLWSGDPYKGVDITLRALPDILKVFPDVKYLVIGRGDDQPRLEKLAQDLGIGEKVVFAGFVATEDLPGCYRLADVYVMPSQEGFGIVYLEAMLSGVPVISGDDDGSAEPLQDGRLGWRVPYRDAKAVARACIEVLEGNDPRCNGEWLRKESLAKFGKQTWLEKLEPLLQLKNTMVFEEEKSKKLSVN